MTRLGDLIKPAKVIRCGTNQYPVLSMTMHDGIMLQSDRFKKSLASVNQSDYKVVNYGQLAVGFPIDEGVLYIQRVVPSGIMSPAYSVWDVNYDIVDPLYLELSLHSPQAMQYYKENLRGTTARRRSIPTDTLLALPLRLPSLEEQRKIAAVLDKVSGLIAKRRQQLDKLDEMVKARFVEMFGDVIQNTKLWPQYVFSDITTSRLGKMLDAKQQTGMCQYPYLANFNVQWFRFELDSLNKMDFDEAERIEFELRDGDLLVCEGGEIGRCAVWHNDIQPCYFQKALHRVRCKKEIVMPDYLAWWFKYNCDNKGFAAIEGAKATISHLPGAKLKSLLVAVPPIKQQKQFATFVEQTKKAKTAISRSLEQLETLKKALMQEYFG